jgi:GGDEF domain-containing protein
VNKPSALTGLFNSSTDEASVMGSVESPPLLRAIRPATFALWLIVFCAEATTVISTGRGANWLVLGLSTALFACMHIQFWYEESEQGRRVHHSIERMRGRIYEDDLTGLPNSRHFVFELRRQMMRSVRNGTGFSLMLSDLGGIENPDAELLTTIARALRQSGGDGDFFAHLQGPIFAAIVLDDRERTAAEKSDASLISIGSCIPMDSAGTAFPVVSLTGYEGELEVRDFLRRAHRDLQAAKSRDAVQMAAANARMRAKAS